MAGSRRQPLELPPWIARRSGAASRPSRPSIRSRRCDVAIVGAGLTGASAAIALASSGLRVIVIDRGVPGSGATSAGTGLVTTGLGEHYAATAGRIGRRSAREVWRWTIENHRLVARLVRRHRLPCGYRRSGCFTLADDDGEMAVLRRSHRLLRADGFPSVLLDSGSVHDRIGGAGFPGGSFNPDDAIIETLAFARGILRVALGRGVQLLARTTATSIATDGGGLILRTGTGSIRAESVVLATNAAGSRVLPALGALVWPVVESAIALRVAADARRPAPGISSYGEVYWRPRKRGLIVGGLTGSVVGKVRRPALGPVVRRRLEAYLHRRFPGLGRTSTTHCWSGAIARTRDGFPLIGPVPRMPGLWTCMGYLGTGFGYATLGGAAVAAGILGHRPPTGIPARFLPGRFPVLCRRR